MPLGPLSAMDILAAGKAPGTRKDQPKNGRTVMHHLSRVNPQMMQQVLSIRGLSDGRRAESTHGKFQHTSTSAAFEALDNHKDLVGSLPRHTNSDSSMPAPKHHCLAPALQQWPSLGSSPGQGTLPPTHTTISRPASLIDSGITPNPQLTIFYNGMVNVYDISAQKAKAIMTLAGNIMDSPHQNPTANATTAASSSPVSLIATSTGRHMTSSELPIARKQSLLRFLEKRKDRLNSAAPYGTEFMSKQLAKDGLSSTNKISSA